MADRIMRENPSETPPPSTGTYPPTPKKGGGTLSDGKSVLRPSKLFKEESNPGDINQPKRKKQFVDDENEQTFRSRVLDSAEFQNRVSPPPAGLILEGGLGGGGDEDFKNGMRFGYNPPRGFDVQAGVRFVPSGNDVNEIWLEALHKRDAYGTAFNAAMTGDLYVVPDGDLLKAEIENVSTNDTEALIGDHSEGVQLYNERGRAMTWKMYQARWMQIREMQARDPQNSDLLVCEYVKLLDKDEKDNLLFFLKDEIDSYKAVRSSFTVKEKSEIKNGFQKSNDLHLFEILKLIEGFYVMKNRPIGDVTEPLLVGYGGLIWKVRGYRRLSARVASELAQLETFLSDWFRSRKKHLTLDMVLQKKELITPMAQLLDTMLVYRYTSHQQPYDMKAVERCGRMYENLCDSMLHTLERVFNID